MADDDTWTVSQDSRTDAQDAVFDGEGPSEGGSDEVAAPEGFGERFSNSFGALLLGLVLVPLACIGLFWNEGHAVHVARALTEAGGVVRTVAGERRDPALDGTLVHVAGRTASQEGAADPQLGIRRPGLVLARKVEMYQWRESQSGSGQDRKYTYARDWSEQPISSGQFHAPGGHENPSFPTWRSRSFGAADARIGEFPVGAEAVQRLGASQDAILDDAAAAAAGRALSRPVRASQGHLVAGLNPDAPRVGDLRITYREQPEGPASFMGKQTAGGLEPYRATNGEEVLLAATGTRSSAELVAKGQDDNRVLAWILRAVGLVVLLVGFASLFAPVNLLASYVPILGSLVGGATFIVALAATVLVGPTVMAIAWLAYRPLLAVGIIAGAALLAFGIRRLRSRRAPARLAPA